MSARVLPMYFLHSFPTSTTIKLPWHDSCFTQMKARLSAVVFPELGGEQMRQKKQEGGGRGRGELEPGPCRGGWVSDSTCLRWENNAPLGLKARGRLPETRVPDGACSAEFAIPPIGRGNGRHGFGRRRPRVSLLPPPCFPPSSALDSLFSGS